MALSQTMTWMIAAGLVIAGWIAVYLVAQRSLKRAVEELRREMEEQISAVVSLVRTTQAPATQPASPPVIASEPTSTPAGQPPIAPEVLVVIAAAITAFLGKKVRIRSAKILETPYELINPWAQQGRVVIQASHNLTQRSHWDLSPR